MNLDKFSKMLGVAVEFERTIKKVSRAFNGEDRENEFDKFLDSFLEMISNSVNSYVDGYWLKAYFYSFSGEVEDPDESGVYYHFKSDEQIYNFIKDGMVRKDIRDVL